MRAHLGPLFLLCLLNNRGHYIITPINIQEGGGKNVGSFKECWLVSIDYDFDLYLFGLKLYHRDEKDSL